MSSEDSREVRRRRHKYDFAAFRGYRGPRFTPIPDEFLDHQLADLSSAEAKVLVFLFRKTYGYRKSGDRVSFAQLQYGTVASDGTIIDRGTGLSRATIWRALKGLQDKGLIEVYRQTTRAGDADVNYYRIREDLGPEEPHAITHPTEPQGRKKPTKASERNQGQLSNSDFREEKTGWSHNETTPVSQLNHPGFTSKRPGGSSLEPTRQDYTRDNYTLSHALEELARKFLLAIGYTKPAPAKREKTTRILWDLHQRERYTLDELITACEIAASMGARGPELIPHVIGKSPTPPTDKAAREKLAAQEQKDKYRWQRLSEEFDKLPDSDRKRLLETVRRSNEVLRQRPRDHPLVRAAAIVLMERERGLQG